ncbi:MAG TPA: DUF1549 and DUF1553 domain-containing protein [Planctomycetaceae bacterium]|nr:DUF1549 and DUF1553 domain-containing protein [Planctomycetaceae bacterium]
MKTFRIGVGFLLCGCVIALANLAFATEPANDPALTEPPLSDLDRNYWAYQPVVRPAVPEIAGDTWSRTPIDRFLLAKLHEQKLQPVEPAARLTLLRRVTFGLTGLPPTPAEQRAAEEASDFDAAYTEIVDRLLTSPAHGEHWAQSWLDLARFAETDGFEHDLVRPEAWRYRDWVINAFNSNLPFDQFVKLQLAADEQMEASDPHRIATGYLLAGPDMPDLNSQEERRHIFWNGMASNVGSVFLGLHFECAECHHHKVDPISHHDFYRLRAFFETIDLFPGKPKSEANDPDDKSSDAPKRKLPVERVVWNKTDDTPTSHLWLRGDFRRPGPEVTAQFPRALVHQESLPSFPAAHGRRTALAEWLTHRNHPLTARVMVNRVWQQHFGVGLKSTSSDFGWQGADVSHPELLDWLAAEFMESGWNLRELHRLIVASAVYRLASYPVPAEDGSISAEQQQRWHTLTTSDRTNQWLGRFSRQRLSGEAIRDAILAVSGELNRKSGGPGVLPPLPPDVASTLLKGQWPVTKEAGEHTRRSIYLFARRNLRLPLLEAYDKPDTNLSCSRRNQSTIAPQALHLLNSEFVRTTARNFAQRVTEAELSTDARVQEAYRLALGRPPSPPESAAAESLLMSQDDAPSGWHNLCHALLNLNEFLYVD